MCVVRVCCACVLCVCVRPSPCCPPPPARVASGIFQASQTRCLLCWRRVQRAGREKKKTAKRERKQHVFLGLSRVVFPLHLTQQMPPQAVISLSVFSLSVCSLSVFSLLSVYCLFVPPLSRCVFLCRRLLLLVAGVAVAVVFAVVVFAVVVAAVVVVVVVAAAAAVVALLVVPVVMWPSCS